MSVKSFSKANPSKKQLEIYNDFSGGLNTELADSATKDNQFRKLINFDMDAAGSLKKRAGLYRLPYIKDIMDNKLKQLINEGKIKYEDYRDIKINDVQQFFDGAHWVFNYITTCGLFVLLLDANMNIPNDLLESEYCLYYSLAILKPNPTPEELEQEIGDKIKISQYGSVYVMYATVYSNATGIINTQKKQVRLFSWNPISNNDITYNNKPLRPQWIEASDNNDLLKLIHYGKTEKGEINSSIIDFSGIPNQTFDIKAGKYIPNFLQDSSIYQYSVEYKTNGVDTCWLEVSKNNQSTQYLIRNGNNGNIPPHQIETCTLEDNRVRIYFTTPQRMKDEVQGDRVSYYRRHHLDFNLETNEFELGITPYFWANFKDNHKDNTSGVGSVGLMYQNLTYNYIKPYEISFWSNTYNQTYWVKNSAANYLCNFVKSQYLKFKNKPFTMFSSDTFASTMSVKTIDNNIIFTDMGALCEFDVQSVFKTSVKGRLELLNLGNKDPWNNTNGYQTNVKFFRSNNDSYDMTFSYNSIFTCFNNPLVLLGQIVRGDYNPNPSYFLLVSNIIKEGVNSFNESFYWNNNMRYAYHTYNGKTDRTTVNMGDLAKIKNVEKAVETRDTSLLVFKQNILGPKNDLSYKNILNKDNTQALATGTYFVNNKNVIPIAHNKNKFLFEKLTTSNLSKWFSKNNLDVDFMVRHPILGSTLFDKQAIDKLRELYFKDLVLNLKLHANYTYQGEKQFVNSNLKDYQIGDFLHAIEHSDINTPRLYLDVLKLNNQVELVNFVWVDRNGKEHLLIDINENDLGFSPSLIVNTLYFSFSFDTLIGGRIENVLSFKQQKYVKPNLNDLNYLWYNLALFSRFGQSRYPDIYNDNIHPNISWDLVDYPNVSDTQQNSPIQLFGIVPVNNVILAPAKQRFQLFYSAREGLDMNNYLIALTAMTIKDYNQMINSPDYSTTGFKNDNAGNETTNSTIGPNWVNFNDLFLPDKEGLDDDRVWNKDKKEWEPKPKKAIFEVDVPTTTQPYMILIQVAQKREEQIANKDVPKLATVIETRIEMQPNSSYIDKIDVSSLFDEYTTTTDLRTFTSSLIMFGNTNKLYFSDITVPSYFPLSKVIELKTPEAIKSCTIFQNKLIVSTENSKWYIGGTSFESETDPYYIKNISTDSGILAPKSDVPLGNYLYFLDTTGIKYLKNLYGTSDKEFSYETLDGIVASQVPRDKDACAVAHNNKYYICFPNNKYMLVYNPTYRAWVSYTSNYLNFAKMFVDDGVLYGIDRSTFNIYKFDENTLVDNWNEIEDGYEIKENIEGVEQEVQKGVPIECFMQTKNLTQNYTPHRKKYDYALLEANVEGVDIAYGDRKALKAFSANITPYIVVDDDLINYNYSTYNKQTNLYSYSELTPYGIIIRDSSVLNNSTIVDFNNLGKDEGSTFYNIPIRRKGNQIAFGFEFNAPTKLVIKSLVIKYGLLELKRNRVGQS